MAFILANEWENNAWKYFSGTYFCSNYKKWWR